MKIKRLILIVVIYSLISLSIVGCDSNQATLALSPQPEIIEKALRIQLDKKYQQISQQLNTKRPQFKIIKINITQIKPAIKKFELPTYQLEGSYQMILRQGKSKRKKITNKFQLYLQRQSAGKTWRMIIPDNYNQPSKYYSYKIS